MKLSDFLKWTVSVTVLCLVYVHLQMKIIDMAYDGKIREKNIKQLIDENGRVTYEILKLTSSKNLGYKLLNDDTDMKFADPKNVVTISAGPNISKEKELANTPQEVMADGSNSIFRFLSLHP